MGTCRGKLGRNRRYNACQEYLHPKKAAVKVEWPGDTQHRGDLKRELTKI